MADLNSLRDNFAAAAAISTSAWIENESGSATVTQVSGQIRFTLPSSTAGTHSAQLTSRYSLDATGSSFYINTETMVSTAVAATAFLQLYLNSTNALQWVQVSGTIFARTIVAGVSTDRFSAAWSGTTYKYVRIRETGGNIEFHSSTNGTTWTLRGSAIAVSSLFPVTDLRVNFGAQCGNVASPGSFRLDDVNLILPAVSTAWNWDNGRRALVNRHKRTTVAIDTANTAQGYIITADGVDVSDAPSGTVRYWSGPAGGGRLLTEQADEATAQAMAVNLPLDGTFDLPEMVDARLFRLGHRSTDGASYSLRSFFPRTLVRASDIEAEGIVALNIAAGAITVDKLDVTLTMTGKTIQTAYNGARVVLSGDPFGGFIGYGAGDTYNTLTGAGTYQVLWSTADGIFYAANGAVRLSSEGTQIQVQTTQNLTRGYRFAGTGGYGVELGGLYGVQPGASPIQIILETEPDDNQDSDLLIRAQAGAGQVGRVFISADQNSGAASATLQITSAGGSFTDIFTYSTHLTVEGGLNVGTATGAVAGEINTSSSVGIIVSDPSNVRLMIRAHDTGSTKYAIFAQNSAAANLFYVRNDGVVSTTLQYNIGSTKVVAARRTGWTAWTGAVDRGSYAPASVTLVQLASAFHALLDDLLAHGLIGS